MSFLRTFIPTGACVLVIGVVPPIAPASLAQGAAAGSPVLTVRSGPREMLPRAEEIALAKSAAPAALSDSASIFVLTDTGYELAHRGSSGAACYVSRGWVAALEPHCFDAEGAKTIMPMEMRRVELLHRGATWEAADSVIAHGLFTGTFRLPRRPAMTYMMSAEQRLVAPNGQVAGRYRPFILLYYPYLTDAEIGMVGARKPAEPGIAEPGGPQARLTVFVPAAIPVRR